MSKLFEKVELLSLDKHRNLKWSCLGSRCPSSCCYKPQRSTISIVEVISLSRFFPIHFPLVIRENGKKEFEMNIMYKLPKDDGPCVYLQEGTGCTLGEYKPISCKQYPFQVVIERNGGKKTIMLDLSCPGFSEFEGDNLLDSKNKLNEKIHKEFIEPSLLLLNNFSNTKEFVSTLVKYGLIIPAEYRYKDMSVPINMVDEGKLLSLPKKDIESLYKKGYLRLIYAHLNSLENIPKLIDAYKSRKDISKSDTLPCRSESPKVSG